MYTIVDSTTGKVLFAKFDNEVLEGQIAINKICTLETETESEIFFNFETQQFYTK
jgi:hypothetical protein